MNSLEIKETLEQAGKFAQNLKIESWDFIFQKSKSLSLSSQNGAIEKQDSSLTQCFGVRVIQNKKIAIAYSEKCDLESIQAVISEALQNVPFSDPSEFQMITEDKNSDSKKEIQVFLSEEDKKNPPSFSKKVETSLILEKTAKTLDPLVVASPYNAYSDVVSEKHYLNSLGNYRFQETMYTVCYTSTLVKENEKSSQDTRISLARAFEGIDPQYCIHESLKNAKAWLNGHPLKTGTYSVLFSPDCFSEFWGRFNSSFSGKEAMKKLTPLYEKLNQKIFDERLTVMDLPEAPEAISRFVFDDEGNSCQPLTLIQDGVLKSFHHNSETARFFKIKTTGHASRSPKSPLDIQSHLIKIAPGKTPYPEIQNTVHLEVCSITGLGSGSNSVTGDFSVGIKGYFWKNGKRVQAVTDCTLSGNFYTMFKENIDKIGSELFWNTYKSFQAPAVLFSNLSIAGN